jgi:hypothetical protein
MMILFVDQVGVENWYINYQFNNDTIIVNYNGISDVFDFSKFTEDGELDIFNVVTELPTNPIISARREDGILYVELLRFISEFEVQEEFSNWIEVNADGSFELEE